MVDTLLAFAQQNQVWLVGALALLSIAYLFRSFKISMLISGVVFLALADIIKNKEFDYLGTGMFVACAITFVIDIIFDMGSTPYSRIASTLFGASGGLTTYTIFAKELSWSDFTSLSPAIPELNIVLYLLIAATVFALADIVNYSPYRRKY